MCTLRVAIEHYNLNLLFKERGLQCYIFFWDNLILSLPKIRLEGETTPFHSTKKFFIVANNHSQSPLSIMNNTIRAPETFNPLFPISMTGNCLEVSCVLITLQYHPISRSLSSSNFL
jgi:hypothetical protein